jgi:hypothetical protein
MRTQIWYALCNVNFKAYLIGILVSKYQRRARSINIFVALVTSSSVAGWTIWDKYKTIWGIIIVVSQVVNIIKPYIPYTKFVNKLNSMSQEFNSLTVDYEKLWYKYNSHKIDENVASNEYFDLKKKLNELLKFDDDIVFSVSNNDKNKANEKMKCYLKSNYNIDIDIKK